MKNPVYSVKELKKPFTFFHTHVIDQQVMDLACKAGKSLEIDVSIKPDGTIYVGHPLIHYKIHNLPAPNNLSLEKIMEKADKANLLLAFDCKNILVLPTVEKAVKDYGAARSFLHAFVKELSLKPWPPKVMAMAEPSWADEELPLEEMLKLKKSTGTPLWVSCHGITEERLKSEGEQLVDKICGIATGVDVINLFVPKGDVVPLSVSERIVANGFLPLVSVDRTPSELWPAVFVGATDNLDSASDPKDFQ